MGVPTAKVEMDPNFEKRVRDAKTASTDEYEARKQGNQTKWMRPQTWEGDPFDFKAMSEPFNRDAVNGQFVQAISSSASPGTTGDVIAASTMIDWLSVMERAMRSRHTMGRPRAMAHMLGRKFGHGLDSGPFTQSTLEYIRTVLQQSKGKAP